MEFLSAVVVYLIRLVMLILIIAFIVGMLEYIGDLLKFIL